MWRQDLASAIKLLNCLFLSGWVLFLRIVCMTQFLTWQSNNLGLLSLLNIPWCSSPGCCVVLSWKLYWGCTASLHQRTDHRSVVQSSQTSSRSDQAQSASVAGRLPRADGGAWWGRRWDLERRDVTRWQMRDNYQDWMIADSFSCSLVTAHSPQ